MIQLCCMLRGRRRRIRRGLGQADEWRCVAIWAPAYHTANLDRSIRSSLPQQAPPPRGQISTKTSGTWGWRRRWRGWCRRGQGCGTGRRRRVELCNKPCDVGVDPARARITQIQKVFQGKSNSISTLGGPVFCCQGRPCLLDLEFPIEPQPGFLQGDQTRPATRCHLQNYGQELLVRRYTVPISTLAPPGFAVATQGPIVATVLLVGLLLQQVAEICHSEIVIATTRFPERCGSHTHELEPKLLWEYDDGCLMLMPMVAGSAHMQNYLFSGAC